MGFVFCAVVALPVSSISPLFHVDFLLPSWTFFLIAWPFIHQVEENIQFCHSDVVSFPSLITQTLCIQLFNYLYCDSVLNLSEGLHGFN